MRVYAKGDRVSQPQYGPGTVTGANEYHTTIDFDEHGPRTFVTRLVVLEPTKAPAPVRVKKARAKRATTPRVAAPEPRQASGSAGK